MSPSEAVAFYRLSAAHCIEVARYISDPGEKSSLLIMAQAWVRLADHVEKYGEMLLPGMEAPQQVAQQQQQPQPKAKD